MGEGIIDRGFAEDKDAEEGGDEMKLPAMVIIFNKEMADKLPCGIKCTFSAHAAFCFDAHHSLLYGSPAFWMNKYGEFADKGHWNGQYWDWKREDYRKLVMTSPDTIEDLFEKFKKAEVPVYMQKTSHDISNPHEHGLGCRCLVTHEHVPFEVKSGTPICLSVLLWREEHKQLLEGMELM